MNNILAYLKSLIAHDGTPLTRNTFIRGVGFLFIITQIYYSSIIYTLIHQVCLVQLINTPDYYIFRNSTQIVSAKLFSFELPYSSLILLGSILFARKCLIGKAAVWKQIIAGVILCSFFKGLIMAPLYFSDISQIIFKNISEENQVNATIYMILFRGVLLTIAILVITSLIVIYKKLPSGNPLCNWKSRCLNRDGFIATYSVVMFVLLLISTTVFSISLPISTGDPFDYPIWVLFTLGSLTIVSAVAFILLAIRRLRDTGHQSWFWYSLIAMIVFPGIAFLIYRISTSFIGFGIADLLYFSSIYILPAFMMMGLSLWPGNEPELSKSSLM